MIQAQTFVEALQARGARFFTGVPDSRLAPFSAALLRAVPARDHVVAANEGNALAMAMGHYLASGGPAVVYMQNSGLGNIVNPFTSLADKEVYAVPMLLVVGWRGAPGEKDEPQHVKQGRISADLLELLEIPHRVLEAETPVEEALDALWKTMLATSAPVALLVKEGVFAKEKGASPVETTGMARERAVECVLDAASPSDCILATTGKTGRELFELRVLRGEAQQDFLCVGGMGHCSSIALGAALAKPDKRFVCLDGDGALLMHMGAMGVIGSLKPENFVHILLNNRCHESVGGQPTCVEKLDVGAIAGACGYTGCFSGASEDEINRFFRAIEGKPGPHFLEIAIRAGARADLGRPTASPEQNKKQFMEHLGKP